MHQQELASTYKQPSDSSKLTFKRCQDLAVGYRPIQITWKDLEKCNVCHTDEVWPVHIPRTETVSKYIYNKNYAYLWIGVCLNVGKGREVIQHMILIKICLQISLALNYKYTETYTGHRVMLCSYLWIVHISPKSN